MIAGFVLVGLYFIVIAFESTVIFGMVRHIYQSTGHRSDVTVKQEYPSKIEGILLALRERHAIRTTGRRRRFSHGGSVLGHVADDVASALSMVGFNTEGCANH
jgi:hypothetical protein